MLRKAWLPNRAQKAGLESGGDQEVRPLPYPTAETSATTCWLERRLPPVLQHPLRPNPLAGPGGEGCPYGRATRHVGQHRHECHVELRLLSSQLGWRNARLLVPRRHGARANARPMPPSGGRRYPHAPIRTSRADSSEVEPKTRSIFLGRAGTPEWD